MRPTIKDVAKAANVSIATVSLVIHNNERISTKTRKKVLRAIKELNYHPSRSARGLVSHQTGNIGFIITEERFLRTEPFYTRVFLGAEFEAREKDYYVLLATIDSSFKEGDPLPRFILERNFDGIIIAGKVPTTFIDSLLKYKRPIVLIDFIPPDGGYPNVLINNIKGGMLATEHLINAGHKNIAFIGGEISHPSIMERLRGYNLALEKANIRNGDGLIVTNDEYLSRQNGYKSAGRLFNNRKDVTAIFASNNATAVGVMQYIKDNGYKIPDDVSLVGFDDVEADLLIDPPLTTIRVPKVEMGTEAVRLLLDILNNKSNSTKSTVVQVELIIRESTRAIKK
ncbi:HTH-type transcriptional repressor CytR [bacterium BMS3Abin03]|nr:HTH-type transcriptional repressor CytR [bacterium BMS3Abin03]